MSADIFKLGVLEFIRRTQGLPTDLPEGMEAPPAVEIDAARTQGILDGNADALHNRDFQPTLHGHVVCCAEERIAYAAAFTEAKINLSKKV